MNKIVKIIEEIVLILLAINGIGGMDSFIDDSGMRAVLGFFMYVCYRFILFIIDKSYDEEKE